MIVVLKHLVPVASLKGKFCTKGSKFLPLRVEGAEKGIDSFGFLESISSHLTPLFCFSLPLKERLSLGNIESIMMHVRERVENGGECSLKEINTMPLCQYLLNPDQISQVGFIVAPTLQGEINESNFSLISCSVHLS